MRLPLRFVLLLALLAGAVLVVVLFVIVAIVWHAYYLARGRRTREQGMPCVHCGRLAFPVEGTTVRYRCGICHSRFDGPEHFE
jgi:hypothetical protein